MEWAQVRALSADGVSQREIARRLGIGRNTLRRLLEEWPEIKAPRVTEVLREDHGYTGSVVLVRKRLATLRPREVRPAQRTGYRPGQVLQVDWCEMPTRPRIAGRERRVYALIAT